MRIPIQFSRTTARLVARIGVNLCMDGVVLEIPEDRALARRRQFYEQLVCVLAGSGRAVFGQGSSRREREWGEGSLFTVPLNVPHRHHNQSSEPQQLIVGITGATGSILGIRLLEVLQGSGVETHLIVSRWGARTLLHETSYTLEQVSALAAHVYKENDQGAVLSSGSFVTSGMIVLPCSMRTLSAIAHGQGDTLIHRAADVVLKERRRLVLAVRESPLNDIHLENMLRLSRMGVMITPPLPAFYNHPDTIDDVVNHMVNRFLDLFDIHLEVAERWSGVMTVGGRSSKVRAPKTGTRSRSR